MILYLVVLGMGLFGLAVALYGFDSRDFRDWREGPDVRRPLR